MTEKMQSTVLSDMQRNGLVLPKKMRFEKERISDCKLKEAKLSDPIFDQCVLENCTFEKSDFSGSRFFNKTLLTNCSFKTVDFQASGFSNTKFQDCTFIKCDFREASLKDCELSNCTFTQCKIIDNSFNAKNIANLKFAGKLQEVNFVSDQPNTPLLADFELCKLDYVTFQNCDLEKIVPPKDTQHIFFKDVSARARKALVLISSEPDNQINKLLKRRLQKLTTQRGAILNIKNLEDYEGPDFTKQFITLLQDA
ncbi:MULTISPECIES: pentapeptide repeat-containing protein [Pseudomonas fluorescens group]|uniref:Pentapeptide repeat-containing protein n=1 Tax=Pseudomonas petroselini TaxID=2899822 RepID=A0ABS8R2L8_9PSED|nr:pentapeptide repeat-containing protein [Pseudomonas marginalis]MCD7042234.1 pentapeptide repeat-containing protein [Pseudomonas petroselini]MCD7046106.1 pentapeptide repeat-containing protein [Pseudomonas petroselini]MCD7068749.1 pentapeptide repeat-containing protein [Pseudomonas petroselini]MCD7081813.1 pentapeptide repeat-containing protein [Pseudomonas petroselini]